MGIDPSDRRYNCHHVIQRSDYKKDKELWDSMAPNGRFDVDGVNNLFPVTYKDHDIINRKINSTPKKKR